MISCTYAIYSKTGPTRVCANEAEFTFVIDTPFGVMTETYCAEHDAISRGRDHPYCEWLRSTPIVPAYRDGYVAGAVQAAPITLTEIESITIFSDPASACETHPPEVDHARVTLYPDEADCELWQDGFDDGWVGALRKKARDAVFRSNTDAAIDLQGVPETDL